MVLINFKLNRECESNGLSPSVSWKLCKSGFSIIIPCVRLSKLLGRERRRGVFDIFPLHRLSNPGAEEIFQELSPVSVAVEILTEAQSIRGDKLSGWDPPLMCLIIRN